MDTVVKIDMTQLRQEIRAEEREKHLVEMNEIMEDIRADLNLGIDEIRDEIKSGLVGGKISRQEPQPAAIDMQALGAALDEGFKGMSLSLAQELSQHISNLIENGMPQKLAEDASRAAGAAKRTERYLKAVDIFLEVSARIVNKVGAPSYLALDHESNLEGSSTLVFRNIRQIAGLPAHLSGISPRIRIMRNRQIGESDAVTHSLVATYFDNGRHYPLSDDDLDALLNATISDMRAP